MVAALFVQSKGCYFGLPNVDPWDEARDARLYAGAHPVVAHPPCQRWGKMWFGQPLTVKRTGERKQLGDDGGLNKAATATTHARQPGSTPSGASFPNSIGERASPAMIRSSLPAWARSAQSVLARSAPAVAARTARQESRHRNHSAICFCRSPGLLLKGNEYEHQDFRQFASPASLRDREHGAHYAWSV